MSNINLLKIDEMSVCDHSFISINDNCYYLLNYTSGVGYSNNPNNSLILNFKKTLDKKGKSEWKYKEQAIGTIVNYFKDLIIPVIDLDKATLVPIPPSKSKTDKLHDDRMTQVLVKSCDGFSCDIRELVILKESMEAVHTLDESNRLNPLQLETKLSLDDNLTDNLKKHIILFDYVITTGSHFVACKNLILKKFPDSIVYGIFVARRAIEK